MSINNLRNELGPYKATKLWNDIVRVFRTGMPIGRHWRQLRSYDDCFVASEAVEWLLDYLHQHHEYGSEITRTQVVKLLQKFHKTHYIEDVRGDKFNSEEFEENNRLFRFVALSPIKTPQWPRAPLSSCTNLAKADKQSNLNEVKTKMTFKDETEEKSRSTTADSNPLGLPPKGPSVTRQAIKLIWKNKVLNRLNELLVLDNLSKFVNTTTWTAEFVKHNMTVLHKNGYVTGIMKADLPPCWVISAMRFLSKWPDKGNETFPEYPGFERDVYVMIKDYFTSLRQPLTTYNLYPALVTVYKLVQNYQPSPIVVAQRPATRRSTNSDFNYPCSRQTSNTQSYRHSTYELRYEHGSSNNSSNNGMIVLYDTPVKASRQSQHYHARQTSSEPCRPTADYHQLVSDSYRNAVDNSKLNVNYNNNKGSSNDTTAYRGWRRKLHQQNSYEHAVNMQRARSLSDLLSMPRVETAFVGEDTYTVYHGIPRHQRGRPIIDPSLRAQSVYNLNTQSDSANRSSEYVTANEGWSGYKSASGMVHSAKSENNVFLISEEPSNARLTCSKPSLYQAVRLNRQTSISLHSNYHSTPSVTRTTPPPSGMLDMAREETLIQCYQLLLLFLPPANRRILHMMLKLMNNVYKNEQLCLSNDHSNKHLVQIKEVLSTLWRCILRSENEAELDEALAIQVCNFLVDNYEQILTVPSDLREAIIREVERTEQEAVKAPVKLVKRQASNEVKAFCERITSEEYKCQVSSQLEQAMTQLLDGIIEDKRMSAKEKEKKLKHFQRTYPEIFASRFPSQDMVKTVIKNSSEKKTKSSIKQTLSNPIGLLRKLR